MARCESITVLERTSHYGDLLSVKIDDGTTALWYYTEADAMRYVGQEVIVDYRSDIYKGQMRTFIKTFTIPTVVHTLDRDNDFKLFLEAQDNNSNIVFSEFENGDSKMGCIVFCTQQRYEASEKAVWMELIIRDRTMHTAKLRIFNYENKDAQLAGRYVTGSLVKSKYGFQSREIAPLGGEQTANPEVDLAEQYIKNYFAQDVNAMTYINRTNLLEVLKQHVDYEVGYGLMRMAMELELVSAMRNVTCDVSLQMLSHVILASYGFHIRSSKLSPSLNNVIIASQYTWPSGTDVTVMLDECAESKPREYALWQNIKQTVNTLLEIRKGTTYGGK